MSETILKIGLSEIKTIRVKVGDVTAEMPLDGKVVSDYIKDSCYGRMNDSDRQRLLNLVVKMAEAKDILETVGIEFVLPAGDCQH